MQCQRRCSPIAYDSMAQSSAVAPSNPTSLRQAVLGKGIRTAGFLFQLGGPNLPPRGGLSTRHFLGCSAPSGDAMPHRSSFLTPTLSAGFSHFFAFCICWHPAPPEEQQANGPPVPLHSWQSQPARPSASHRRRSACTRCAGLLITSAYKGWLCTSEGASSAPPGTVPRVQGPAPTDKLLLLTRKMQGCYIRNLCTKQRTKWVF